jgi:hypothetical protein
MIGVVDLAPKPEPPPPPVQEPPHDHVDAPVVPHVAPAYPRERIELGAFTGYHSVAMRDAIDVERNSMLRLDDGMTFGLRGGYFRSRYGVEAEVGMSALGRDARSGTAEILTSAVHGSIQHDEDRVSLRLLAGASLMTVVSDSGVDTGAPVLGFSWGGAATYTLRNLLLRVDLRHELAAGHDDTIGQALQATFGASMRIW